MIDIKELLGLITEEVVIKIMEENSAPLHHTSIDGQTGQKLLWFRTICHRGDSYKLCYFTQSKDFYCYTSCGRMPFFEFIKRIRNASDKEFYTKVVLYIAQKVGKSLSNTNREFNIQSRESIRNQLKSYEANIDSIAEVEYLKDTSEKNIKVYDSSILNYFDKDTFYEGWIKEGITIPSMEKFGIEWYEYEKYIIIPHHDMYGNLIGIRRRSLKPEDSNNKYMPLFIENKDYGHSLGMNLYGLYQNMENITNRHEAIIVEGEKSVMQADSFFHGHCGTVATCGFNISQAQIQLLEKTGVDTVFLGFDKDFDDRYEEIYKADEATYKGYLRYKERIDTLAHKLSTRFRVYVLKDVDNLLGIKDSPFDKGKDVFLKIKEEAYRHQVKTNYSEQRLWI